MLILSIQWITYYLNIVCNRLLPLTHTQGRRKGGGGEQGGEMKNHKISLKGSPLKGSQLRTSHGSWLSDFLDPEHLRNILMGGPLE